MRPWMAAILFLMVLLGECSSIAQAQQAQPRRFPELLEIMQADSSAPPQTREQVRPPALVRTPANFAEPLQGSRPIIPVTATPAAIIPATGRADARPAATIVQTAATFAPLAAPPASFPENSLENLPVSPPAALPAAPAAQPLTIPPPEAPTETILGERQFVTSPVHIMNVHDSIPSQPLVLPQAQQPLYWQPTSYEADAIAPPQPVVKNQISPLPEPQIISPTPGEFSSSMIPPPTFTEHWSPDQYQATVPDLSGETSYDYASAGEAACDGCPCEGRVVQNPFFTDTYQAPDPCGEFLPFGNLGVKGGNERVIGGGGFFLPIWQNCDSLVFTDLHGTGDDHRSGDGYFGLGYRTYMDPQWVFGTYIYADLIATNQRNYFGQAQFGLEVLSLNWDFRVNGYAPGHDVQGAHTQNGISNGTAITRNFGERAYPGFDVEIGRRLLNWGLNDKYEVRWFMGGYGFSESSRFPSFGGPRTRLEMRVYDLPWCGQQSRLELGTEFSYDRIRNEQIYGFLRVRIPFGGRQGRPALDPLRRRLVDTPVHRID